MPQDDFIVDVVGGERDDSGDRTAKFSLILFCRFIIGIDLKGRGNQSSGLLDRPDRCIGFGGGEPRARFVRDCFALVDYRDGGVMAILRDKRPDERESQLPVARVGGE